MAKKVLIIEDEDALRDLLKDELSKTGFVVLEAKIGKEGVSVALAEHPDLILLDILLPDLDGVEVLRTIRADDWGKKVKVVMLTNLSDARHVADTMALGSNDFLVKSDWKLKDVMKIVHQKLKD